MVGAVEHIIVLVPGKETQAVDGGHAAHLLVALVNEALFAEIARIRGYLAAEKFLRSGRQHEAHLHVGVLFCKGVHRVKGLLHHVRVVFLEHLYHLVVEGVNAVYLLFADELFHFIPDSHPVLAAGKVVGKVGLEVVHPAVLVAHGDVIPLDGVHHLAEVLRLVHLGVIYDIRELFKGAVLILAALLLWENCGGYRYRKCDYREQSYHQLCRGHPEFHLLFSFLRN